eukprot:IDg10668t1
MHSKAYLQSSLQYSKRYDSGAFFEIMNETRSAVEWCKLCTGSAD